MERSTKRLMKRDCRKYMAKSFVAAFFHRLTAIASPTVAAWMIGDMANHLLTLNKAGIAACLPGFLCAVFFQVVVVCLFRLMLNLLLTKQGFDYESSLMERFIHLPLTTVENTDAGAVMERLEEDSAAFCWNQMILLSYPGAILLYGVVFVWGAVSNQCPALFAFTILALGAVPVIRAARTGKRQTELKKETAEFHERRKQMELELFDGRDLAVSFSLESFFTGRLETLFQSFLKKTGITQNRMNGKTEILDFLCDYGAKLTAILIGAVLISFGKLTLGALLSGYLMIPAVTQGFQYVQEWVREKHDEGKNLNRLAIFYAPQEESAADTPVTALEAENVSFTYPANHAPTLENVNFRMTDQENCRLAGENGCGKTTLVSLLTGLYEPSAGKVCGGASLGSRRNSTSVQEQTGTIFSGTVWDNLFAPESLRERAGALLKSMGLEKPLDYPTEQEGANLSPGERKKVLLTRALLRKAPFLILDEPLNHLDAQGKETLLRELENRQGGILLISHQDMTIGGKTLPVYNMSKR